MMSAAPPEPVRTSVHDRVFTMTLNTPGSAINVLDDAMADQLRAGLRAARRAGARLVVLRSAKPGSFLNGASLLLSSSQSTPEGVLRASAPLRQSFAELAASPIPTLAVIEGNCFGCGFELVLCCDFRVAADIYPVVFYMTEIVDYRLVPIFGGTQRLPRLVGTEAAARLLLDGERWDARAAERAGLLDAVYQPGELDAHLAAFIAHLPSARRRRPTHRNVKLGRGVPPTRRELFATCLALVNESTKRSLRRGLEAELRASVRSICTAEARQASAYFFVRQMGQAASWGTAEPAPPELTLRAAGGGQDRLATLLRQRFRGVHADAVALGPPGGDDAWQAQEGWRPLGARPPAALVSFPGHALTEGFCEVALAREVERAAILPLGQALRWVGFEAIATRPAQELVSNRLLTRYALELSRLLQRATVEDLSGAAFAGGFTRLPADVLAPFSGPGGASRLAALSGGRLPASAARRLLAAMRGRRGGQRRAHPGLLAPLWAGLTSEIAACIDDGSLTHPAQGDVLVQRLFDFPIERGSLLLEADRTGLGELLDRARAAGWVEGERPKMLEQRLVRGLGFYSTRRAAKAAEHRRVVVVTGALGDLGSRVVERLAAGDATVIASDLPRRAEIAGATYVSMDVRSEASVRHLRDVVLDRFGRVDALVNCAGYFTQSALLAMPDVELERTLEVNLTGAWRCLRAFAQTMVRQRSGRIVTVASLAAHRALPGAAAYAAAKGGVISLMRTAAVELAPHGVSVTSVVPGFIDSPLTRRYMTEHTAGWLSRIPMGRLADKDEVAEAIEFLVTSRGTYMTGTELVIDGGYDAT